MEAHFCGFRPAQLASLPNAWHHGTICDYNRFLRRFSRAGYDIGLAPLPDGAFYRAKTNNKFREYGACRIAGIYSRNEVYTSCVQQEVTGLLVDNNTDSWRSAIERLINDAALRERIQRNARKYVAEHYSQEKFDALFLAQLDAVVESGGTFLSLSEGRETTGRTPFAGTATCYPNGTISAQSDAPGPWHRLTRRALRSLGTMRRLGPKQSWAALRWLVHDRCLALWLRWRL